MEKSDNIEVQKLIDRVKLSDNTKYEMLNALRELAFDILPKAKERIMYGGIMISLQEDVGGLFVYKNHISFEFSFGYKFEDPGKLLEGKGEFRRHLKLRSLEDIETKRVDFYIKQIEEIEN